MDLLLKRSLVLFDGGHNLTFLLLMGMKTFTFPFKNNLKTFRVLHPSLTTQTLKPVI